MLSCRAPLAPRGGGAFRTKALPMPMILRCVASDPANVELEEIEEGCNSALEVLQPARLLGDLGSDSPRSSSAAEAGDGREGGRNGADARPWLDREED